tara:strand:+ start:44 stop:166 length:123 start_codon:yes stop_codon:yes gene_type:complete
MEEAEDLKVLHLEILLKMEVQEEEVDIKFLHLELQDKQLH